MAAQGARVIDFVVSRRLTLFCILLLLSTLAHSQVEGSKWEEVRGSAILQCRPASVVHLFETDDVDLIRSFNPMYAHGYDIERFSETAKAAYGRVKSGERSRCDACRLNVFATYRVSPYASLPRIRTA